MRISRGFAALATVFVCSAAVATMQESAAKKTTPTGAAKAATHAAQHVIVAADEVKWGPAPPAMPTGAEAAVLQGDPSKPGPFVIRAKFPDGYVVPPHWHPTDEGVTVLSGTLRAAMGEKMDEGSMKDLATGSYVFMPRKSAHYVKAKGETVVQIQGAGPFEFVYINPQDDPRRKKTTE